MRIVLIYKRKWVKDNLPFSFNLFYSSICVGLDVLPAADSMKMR